MSVIINGTTGITSPGGDVSAVDNTVSGLTVGKGGGSVATNTAVGYQAGNANTTGAQMVAIGYQALAANTTVNASTAVGYLALTVSTGANNTGLGRYALGANTTGTENAAVGRDTIAVNTTGSYNTALGNYALGNNTTASNNTAVGYQAGYSNTTGTSFTAMGYKAGYSQTTVNGGTYFGTQAGQITTGEYNTMVGAFSGYFLTTGTGNTFVGTAGAGSGSGCGGVMTTGSKNTIIGAYSGNQGGLDIRTLSNYIVLSDGDGNPRIITNPVGNTLFGANIFVGSRYAQVGIDLNGRDDALFIQNYGNGLGWGITMRPSASASGGNGDCINFTNTSFTQVGKITTTSSATAYATSSDYRLKENVAPMTGALDTVAKLKPVTFTWKLDGKDGQGFIAHELQAVVPDCVSGEKDAVDAEGNPVYQGIDTSFLVATLTAAIQELKAEFDAYKSTHP